MGDKTKINYANATWNPVAGCTPVSAGCDHCFAARYARRHLGAFRDRSTAHGDRIERLFGVVRCREDQLAVPLRWRRPRTILVPTLGDLFHPDVPVDFLDYVLMVMAQTPQHHYLVLTKRPRLMSRALSWSVPLSNVWLGVSVEDQQTAAERIPILLQTNAAHRWISYEPALGPLNLREMAHRDDWHVDALDTPDPTRRLEWVVIGGETGSGARACCLEWIADVIDQCAAARVPIWVKSLGREVLSGTVPDYRALLVRERAW